MSWWEIIAIFVGIPIAIFMGLGALVFWLTGNRIPDGLAAASEQEPSATATPQNESGNQPEAPRGEGPADPPAEYGPIIDPDDDGLCGT